MARDGHLSVSFPRTATPYQRSGAGYFLGACPVSFQSTIADLCRDSVLVLMLESLQIGQWLRVLGDIQTRLLANSLTRSFEAKCQTELGVRVGGLPLVFDPDALCSCSRRIRASINRILASISWASSSSFSIRAFTFAESGLRTDVSGDSGMTPLLGVATEGSSFASVTKSRRRWQAGMVVYSGQPTIGPPSAPLGFQAANLHGQDFPPAFGVGADGGDRGHGDDAAVLARIDFGGVGPEAGPVAFYGAIEERLQPHDAKPDPPAAFTGGIAKPDVHLVQWRAAATPPGPWRSAKLAKPEGKSTNGADRRKSRRSSRTFASGVRARATKA